MQELSSFRSTSFLSPYLVWFFPVRIAAISVLVPRTTEGCLGVYS